jgi:adenylate cyclase
MSIEPAQAGAPSDWSQLLRRDLLPRVQDVRERSAHFLGESPDAPAEFHTDAERLDRASDELLEASRYLVSLGGDSGGLDVLPLVRKARHALLNILNRVLGYSQLLLEGDEDEPLGPLKDDLERIYELGRECEGVIGQHLHPDRLGSESPAPVVRDECAPPLAREVVRGTILIADDDADIRAGLVRALRAQGHTLVEATDGQDALERLRAGSFDLVLLDITMPRVDGYEVLRQMKGDPRLASVPVLMVSALNEFAHTARCIEAGAEDFLPKPVDHVLLRARVNSLVLRQQLRVRELEQFFPREVARQLIDRPEVFQEGTQTGISVLFCDIRGYSRISRRLGPGDTIKWVSSVMEELTDCIHRNGGVVVDFIGDELLAMWGAPTNQPNHAELACKTALEMFACLPELNRRWQERLSETMDFGIGINSGVAWVGNSGTRRKFKYGPSGDTVNVGSRVQGATKYLKAPLIVTRATHDQLKGKFASRRLASVKVVNIAEPVELYEVVRSGLPSWRTLKRRYEEALKLYEERRLHEAAKVLSSLIARYGAAGPPLALMARVVEGLLNGDAWSAVFQLPGK